MTVRILIGDVRELLKTLPSESMHCCVTSPPYFGLRDYGVAGQIGLEPTPDAFVAEMIAVFREVRRVLRDDGTLWLNLGDSYAGSGRGGYAGGALGRAWVPPPLGLKQKDLIGIPWMVAFALRADGWYLRQDIIWSKPNPMPESVTDRCTKAHEYIFLLSKSARYYYDAAAIKEQISASTIERWGKDGTSRKSPGSAPERNDTNPDYRGETSCGFSIDGRNKRSVWEIATSPYTEAHFATFPPALIEPCILASCPIGGHVLDPFGGAGTTGLVADRLQRHATLIELNPEYAALAKRRIFDDAPLLMGAAE